MGLRFQVKVREVPQSLSARKSQRSQPNDQKIKSRSKFSIPIEFFNPARKFQSRRLDFPTKIGPRWVARSKISFSIEIFNLARNHLEALWDFCDLRLRCPSPEIGSDFRDITKQCCLAIEGCDGKSLAISAIQSCDFRAQKLFFLQEFWRFGSVNAEIASDCDCAILLR